MKPSMKDQVKGKFHEVKGKVKETAGKAINDPDLKAEGQSENLAGKVQKKIGQIKKVFER
ncbi:MAG: CsbD family protein [Acidobacteriia bacterium]|nr:CsbD family protein [Terriglobia bacterium]